MYRGLMVALIIAGVMGILFSLYVAIGTPNMVHVRMSVVRADYCTNSFNPASAYHGNPKFVEVSLEDIKKVPKLMEVLQKADKNMEEYLNDPRVGMYDGCYIPNPLTFGVGPSPGLSTDITIGDAEAIKSILAHAIRKDEIRKVDAPPNAGFNQSYVLERYTDMYISVDGKKYYILIVGVGT
jgi:hypothetical protein